MAEARSDFQQYLKEQAQHVEEMLRHIIPEEWDFPAKLREAVHYSLEAGGKRIRPVMVLAAAESIADDQGAVDAAYPVAAAIELIHTYSLVHDDLPAMDDDDYRRGKPTNHKVYGEAVAILAGDAMLTHAFYCVSLAAKQKRVSAETALAIVEELSILAGAAGMVGGQAADVLGEQGITSLTELNYIHLHKTSDLIVFSLKAGGRIAGAQPYQLEALAGFGQRIGLAFQIQDDILDLIGDEQKLGKKTNSDVNQNKVTYPYLIGLEESKAEVARLTNEAKALLLSANLANPKRLLELADYLVKRDR
ncbi:polyprenyl synthetase family protein [Paenibacillus sp. GCM10012307]|uniref:Farnesyl diphosphate synthase n=1 Tax=Paenibacillus roseus TaxID=2798579 RepID=A0A934J3T1_9BACL|nr:polyprenyl synthetase family protein [Paenibacillus roseus]